ncbi:hypothetical protein MTO96_001305 [Rhipicephalus appendiculatus]
MNSSTFYGLRKAREKTTACDIPSGSEDSDISDSDDDYLRGDQEGLLVKTSKSRFKPKKHGDRLPQCHP